MNTREIGNIAEQKSCDYLSANGYTVLERNYSIPEGEIDIIALKDNVISAVEVKKIPEYWDDSDISYKIDRAKIYRIKKTMSYYLAQMPNKKYDEIRFDVIAVKNSEIRHYKGAF